ncbi:exodeoxyribonuclease V subunit beta [Bowmanella dokdonensis]|uniref:RecBCD enzyme subunit RecB n=1 Tax=Bowmanella dokdonensis TaxID=751969 RepID=A0A939DLA7_9ALTE|nr:exodeoxyribonuclease V subunit beta [Bowmanella dokdonensis]MBN7824660.1 exodeoxyribonuclease V subunit beta [Bowmanella dokdonensis]
MKSLDILSFPLHGQSLIEASAGTGKTYTIVHLYLRLVLGHGCTPHQVDSILVVTFTNAATAELKGRIRELVSQTSVDFQLGQSNNPLVQAMIEDCEDRTLACFRLQLALKQMDEAAVFTIHGFCQRVLVQHAFESGSRYQQELILDESDHLHQAINDFWRRRVLTLPAPLLTLTLQQWSGPNQLLARIRGLLAQPVHYAMPGRGPDVYLAEYQRLLVETKAWWLSQQVGERLWQASLNKRSVLGKGAVLSAMEHFCQGDGWFFAGHKDGWQTFSAEKIAKAATKASPDLGDLNFTRFEQLHHLQQQMRDSLVVTLCGEALQSVRSQLISSKSQANQLSPDDLLSLLQQALKGENAEALAEAVRRQYPCAMIDEFQDTDAIQYRVFSRLYGEDPALGLIMIGDPKQAIYAFRGADIFTYIQAKRQVGAERHFTLDTNWRSEPALVTAVNGLFAQSPQGFLFNEDIPFTPVKAGQGKRRLLLDGQGVGGLQFDYLEGEQPVGFAQIQSALAGHFAARICDWLQEAATGRVRLADEAGERPVQPGDCAVLVRDRFEAQLMKQALMDLGIASVFQVRRSVFGTQVARDLYLLLEAIHHPGDERAIKAAMLSELVGLSAARFESWLTDDSRWQELLFQFHHWQRVWQRQGIASALAQAQQSLGLFATQLQRCEDGLRRVTDLRHLFELLQQQSQSIQGESQLLRWYQYCLIEPDDNQEGQQLRLETDDQLVQIVTMHASKGLEYPLVFIPFAARVVSRAEALYHDDEHRLQIDFLGGDEARARAARERLAEDIRLLYVALTRARHHCSVGVWLSNMGRGKATGLQQTALGALLFDEQRVPDASALTQKLTELTGLEGVTLAHPAVTGNGQPLRQPGMPAAELRLAPFTRSLKQRWRLTSYSAIAQQQDRLPGPGHDEGNSLLERAMPSAPRRDRFGFIRGARAGSFLHGVLEHLLGCDAAPIETLVAEQGQKFGIEQDWWPVVCGWLEEVLSAPLFTHTPLTLADLQQVKIEMEFHLPLEKVQAVHFNRILAQHLGPLAGQYDFDTLSGVLKGYVDLIFSHQGKLYVADYKSNYLGDSLDDYDKEAMEQAMQEHDYHLQALLYSLALHRWLKSCLADYDYDRHVGGACYWFLRGMSGQRPGHGCYLWRVPKALILALDDLFDGRTENHGEGEQLSLC